ncbi:MAG TPA: radical SAM protein [Candidatus Limnocylindria bacterium]|nr:radical SAM protein [Candidatus Limnocylindria bacterium]
MSKETFTLKYLARAAAGGPRDVANLVVSHFKPIRPTVLIYNCTWVCDARCEMCSNWKHGDRKSDMTLEQLERVMNHRFWGAIENLNISGGEPTTRNDLPEMVELFHRHLPRLRKIGINTTGLTPHRAIPMLTRIVEFCDRQDVLLSIRVSLDGIGDTHNLVRHVQRGFEKACQTIEAMQALAERHRNFQFGIAATIFGANMKDARKILAWARERKLDIVFNMLRFSDNMLNNKELEPKIRLREREEAFMREFFLDRVAEESVLSGQAFMYLHYADMIANGYHRTMPCPFQRQGLLLNPDGSLYYCENSAKIGNVLTTSAEELYFRAENLAHREAIKREVCGTCLSPCQVNVGALKQFVPYAKFLVRAWRVKRELRGRSQTTPAGTGPTLQAAAADTPQRAASDR